MSALVTSGAAVALGVVAPTLLVAHQVADHWVQTSVQARDKGAAGWAGRRACAAHVATYTVTLTVTLLLVSALVGLHLSVAGVAAGQVVSAASHYVADRRTPLERMAARCGLAGFFALGAPREGRDDPVHLGTGAYALDQAWHRAWLLVAALVTVLVGAP